MIDYILIQWVHFFSDFILQSDKMALNKNASLKYLGIHCIVYSVPFLYFGFIFAIINGLLHFVIDFISSKITKRLWDREQRYWFFVVIGIDQAIHITCIIILFNQLNK